MPKTKNGGFIINEPDAALGPYALKVRNSEEKTGKGKKLGTVKKSGKK